MKSPKLFSDEDILEKIQNIQEKNFNSVGYREMTRTVSKELGKKLNKKHVLRLMKEHNLLSALRRKRFSDEVYVKRRELKAQVPGDLIQRNFFALEPRKRMVEDITYLYGKEKRMYLNTIEDLFNGEILAYCISDSPDSQLCIDTVKLLCQTWGECFEGSIIHNDLGSTYVSYEYMDVVKAHGIRQSIGRVAMESLNGIIKTEALYCRFGKTKVKERRVPIDEIVGAVIEFINRYNNERPKERLGGLSPVEFRLQNPKGTYPMVIR